MAEADFQGNLPDGQFPLAEELGGALDPSSNQILVHGKTDRLTKQRFEMRNAYGSNIGDLAKRYVLAEILFDEGHDFPQFTLGHFPLVPVVNM
jgi:hypothetical protein